MNSNNCGHVISHMLERPWALTPAMVSVVANVVAERFAGQRRSDAEIADVLATAHRPTTITPRPTERGTVAILPIHGVLGPRFNVLAEISGGTSYDVVTTQLRALGVDTSVRAILLDVDSPGGSVAGAPELAAEIRKVSAVKPVIAQATYSMCSAAYWICSGASEIIASPSSMVGSIGVFAIHDDISGALEKFGIKRNFFIAGKHKGDAVEGRQLDEEGRARFQKKVDAAYAQFVRDVAAGRGVLEPTIKNGYGQGDSVLSSDALALGMIDGVATADETLRRLAASPTTAAPRLTAQRTEATRASLVPLREQLARAQLAVNRRQLAAYSSRMAH